MFTFKHLAFGFLALLPSILCIVGAVTLLLVRGGDSIGWGWLLFIAILIYPSGLRFGKDKDDDEE